MHTAITRAFKHYHLFGFTGTPIFAANSSSGGNPLLKTTQQAKFREIPTENLTVFYEQPFIDWVFIPMVYYIFRQFTVLSAQTKIPARLAGIFDSLGDGARVHSQFKANYPSDNYKGV